MHNAAACGNSQSDEWRLDMPRHSVFYILALFAIVGATAFSVSPSPHLTLVNPLGNPP